MPERGCVLTTTTLMGLKHCLGVFATTGWIVYGCELSTPTPFCDGRACGSRQHPPASDWRSIVLPAGPPNRANRDTYLPTIMHPLLLFITLIPAPSSSLEGQLILEAFATDPRVGSFGVIKLPVSAYITSSVRALCTIASLLVVYHLASGSSFFSSYEYVRYIIFCMYVLLLQYRSVCCMYCCCMW